MGDLFRIDAGVFANTADAVKHADRRIFRSTRHLGRENVTRLFIDEKEIRKRTSDVNA